MGSVNLDPAQRNACYTPNEDTASAGPPPPTTPTTPESALAIARYNAFSCGEQPVCDPCSDPSRQGYNFDSCVISVVPHPTLFATQQGDVTAIDPKDVQQEAVGDCALMSTLAALAATPAGRAVIHNAISENRGAQGDVVSYNVTLYQHSGILGIGGGLGFGDLVPITTPVSGPFPCGHAEARVGPGGSNEMWPLIIEAAFAKLAGSYNALSKPWFPSNTMEALTGQPAEVHALGLLSSYGKSALTKAFKAGKLVVLLTKEKFDAQTRTDAKGLLDTHAYSLVGMGDDFSSLILHNPWNADEPRPIPISELTKWFSSFSVGSVK